MKDDGSVLQSLFSTLFFRSDSEIAGPRGLFALLDIFKN